MIKMLGAILVVASCTAMGLGVASQMRHRVRVLSSMILALQMMRGEISLRLTPLPELVGRLSEEAPIEVQGFFKELGGRLDRLGDERFSEIWVKALEKNEELGLGDGELAAMKHLGSTLGRFNREEQEAALNRCISELEDCRSAARNEVDTQGKLFTGLGVAGGITLAIMLV